MTLLGRLPSELWHAIIDDWLELPALSRLDVAVTNTALRPQYLALLRMHGLVLRGLNLYLEDSYFEWISARKLQLNALRLRRDAVIQSPLLAELTLALRSLQVDYLSENHLPSIVPILAANAARQSLQELVLPNCRCVRAVLSSIPSAPSLHTLNLRNLASSCGGLESAFSLFPNLQSVSLSSCLDLSSALLSALATSCPHIQDMDLSRNSFNLHDMDVVLLSQSLPGLTSLNISACIRLTGTALEAVATHCHGLERLLAAGLPRLTDSALRSLAANVRLSFSHVDFSDCPQLTDLGLSPFLERCACLRSLRLGQCHHLSNYTVIRIAECCTDLEELDMNYCYKLTDIGLLALSRGCGHLSSLRLDFCQFLTCAGLYSVAASRAQTWQLVKLSLCCLTMLRDESILDMTLIIERLQELNVAGCVLLSDVSMLHILATCAALRVLHASDNNQITDLFIEKIVGSSSTRMKELSIDFCGRITEGAVARLAADKPWLRVSCQRAPIPSFPV